MTSQRPSRRWAGDDGALSRRHPAGPKVVSAQTEECEHGQHDDDETNDVDDVVHGFSSF